MKIILKLCTKCNRKTLQVPENHQAVHTIDREIVYFEGWIKCYYCTSCGKLTSNDPKCLPPIKDIEVFPGRLPKQEPDNPGSLLN